MGSKKWLASMSNGSSLLRGVFPKLARFHYRKVALLHFRQRHVPSFALF